jgi:hypothetical protein
MEEPLYTINSKVERKNQLMYKLKDGDEQQH